jgi:hypothetical protein
VTLLIKDEKDYKLHDQHDSETYRFNRIFSITVNPEKTHFIFEDGSDGAFETVLNRNEYYHLIEELMELMWFDYE